jgi:hypothetical protein
MKRRLLTLMLGVSLGLALLTGCGAEGEGEEGEDLNTPGFVQPGEGGEGEGDD